MLWIAPPIQKGGHPVTHRWAPLALGVAVCLAAVGCTPATSKAATTTAKELARSLAGSGDDVARLEKRVLAANGGRTTIKIEIADALRTRPGVVDKIWKTTDPVRDLACRAWKANAQLITTAAPGSLAAQEAQDLLNRMRTETIEGRVVVEAVNFSCDLAGLVL